MSQVPSQEGALAPVGAAKHERDEHFVRRLEGFGDVVIGFSLAELTLGLAIPARASQLLVHPMWLVYYLFTFAIVAQMWWTHYRLLRVLFMPDTVNVILSYAWLATVGLLVYFMQVLAHGGTYADMLVAEQLYFSTLALNFVTNSVMTARSLKVRGVVLAQADRRRISGLLLAFALVIFLLVVGVLATLRYGIDAAPYVALAIPVGFFLGPLLRRLVTHFWSTARPSTSSG